MVEIDWTNVERDTEVKVSGTRNQVWFFRVADDNSVTVYGGSKNPLGRRGIRTFPKERVTLA